MTSTMKRRIEDYERSLLREPERADERHKRTTQFLRRQVLSYSNGGPSIR